MGSILLPGELVGSTAGSFATPSAGSGVAAASLPEPKQLEKSRDDLLSFPANYVGGGVGSSGSQAPSGGLASLILPPPLAAIYCCNQVDSWLVLASTPMARSPFEIDLIRPPC